MEILMLTTHKLASSLSVLATIAGFSAVACGGAPDEGPAGAALTADSTSQTLSAHSDDPVLPSPTLAVPAGNRLAFHYDAVGVQIYGCQATATGYGWVFQAPEATLYGKHGKIEGKHYAGPTWESHDGSTVVGKKLVGFTADPTAIPELLLQAVSNTGVDGHMSNVTYVQRLDTVGGLAPTTGCDATAAAAKATARIDYTATYYFYVPSTDDVAADD